MEPRVPGTMSATSLRYGANDDRAPPSKSPLYYETMEHEVDPTQQARLRNERDHQCFSGSSDPSYPTQYAAREPLAHGQWSRSMSMHGQQRTAFTQEECHYLGDASNDWGDAAQPDSTAESHLQREDDKAIIAAVQCFVQAAAPPPYAVLSPLNKPVAVPQITQSKTTNLMAPPGSGASSYARLYSPTLMQHGISETEFLTFIDGLNVVCTSSQKLQALSLANTVLSFDPSGSMQTIAMVASVAAQVTQQKIFDRRAAVYLNRANTDFFNTRGLRVHKCTLDELRGIAHIPEDAPLRIPVDAVSICSSVAENLARALKPWLAPLKFDVAPVATLGSLNALQKLNKFQAKHFNKQLERELISHRLKELSRNPENLSQEEVSSIAASVRASGGRTLGWQVKRFEKKMARDTERSRSCELRVDKKEEKAALRSNWLVITPLVSR